MKRLSSIARRPAETGDFLPSVFFPLEQAGIRLRAGTATYVAGTPGSMKTGWTLYYVARVNLPTLYFSADSEPFEMMERAASMVSGNSVREVRADPARFAEVLDTLDIRLVFNDAPTYSDVELEVAAYAEMYGAFPKIIVIDNLLNLTGENENEWGAHRDHAKVIHRLTRITKAAMLVLCHMGEDRVDPSEYPQPRTKLQGKVSHLPKVILSLAFDGQRLRIAAVKNRFGPGDASGRTYVELYCTPDNNRFFNTHGDMLTGRSA